MLMKEEAWKNVGYIIGARIEQVVAMDCLTKDAQFIDGLRR